MNQSAARSEALAIMDMLLQPLPGEAEQPNDPAFQRQILVDLKGAWSLQKMLVDATAAERRAAGLRQAYAWKRSGVLPPARLILDQSREPHFIKCDKLMRIPAPTVGALRWKEATRGCNGGLPEWEAMIASDQARLLQRREAGQ